MKTLHKYLEELCSTPANTMGMGNPGEVAPDTLTEPIGTAKAIRQNDRKKKKIKRLSESIFDRGLSDQNIGYGSLYEFGRWGSSGFDEGRIDDLIPLSFSVDKMKQELKKSFWKKFLTYEDDWERRKYDYFDDEFFYLLTRVIMSCSSLNEIKHQLYNIIELSRVAGADKQSPKYVKEVEIFPLPAPRSKTELRMVVVKFICNDPAYNIVVWATVYKKDS